MIITRPTLARSGHRSTSSEKAMLLLPAVLRQWKTFHDRYYIAHTPMKALEVTLQISEKQQMTMESIYWVSPRPTLTQLDSQ
jgi:hypothetical protein